MKKKLRKSWLIWLASLLFIGLGASAISGVYAALKDDDQVTNDFQMGDLTNVIEENFIPPTETNPMTPGREYPKEVSVTNPGTVPLFVRMLVVPEIVTAEGELLASGIGEVLKIDLGKEWVLGEDGYYYYLGKLGKAEKTANLFSKVTLDGDVATSYIGASLKLHLKSETVIAEGNKYRDAWWLGATPTTGVLQTVDTKLQALQNK